ncbi:MAG: hypothetical protein NVS1B14_01720 [Vulcanimicrobiaceae bacterium]
MPLIQKQEKPPTLTQLNVRVEQPTYDRFTRYCEYLESSPAHVVARALEHVMENDSEFASWSASHPAIASNGHGAKRK